MNLRLLLPGACALLLLAACGGLSEEVRKERADCRQGDYSACIDLGDRYQDGDEVEQDLDRAATLYRRTCRHDHFLGGCTALASLASEYESQAIALEDAERELWRACRTYDVVACDDLIELYSNSDLSIYDIDRAQAVAQRLCDDGFYWHCDDFDSDGDGVGDDTDACPQVPEDADGYEDEDGCPDPDNDGDGLADAADNCPNEAEDADDFEDEDGCPDPDNDGDGLLDSEEACDNLPEDLDGWADTDGCPDLDNDRDGFEDTVDACPDEAEDFDGFEDDDGCPEEGEGLVSLTCEAIEIRDAVYFGTGSDVIEERSYELLNQVASILTSVPYITKMEVGGHTDDRGSDDSNRELSQRRADSVRSFLIGAGVEADRLESVGYGEVNPIADNGTSAGRAENRRVEFVITEQDDLCP